jgi:hypothetical protein
MKFHSLTYPDGNGGNLFTVDLNSCCHLKYTHVYTLTNYCIDFTDNTWWMYEEIKLNIILMCGLNLTSYFFFNVTLTTYKFVQNYFTPYETWPMNLSCLYHIFQ